LCKVAHKQRKPRLERQLHTGALTPEKAIKQTRELPCQRRSYRSRSVDARATVIQIEKDHADVDFHTVNHYWKVVEMKYSDATHAEELEREVDRLEALSAAVGLSEEERARLNSA